jgi:hypothetical protein
VASPEPTTEPMVTVQLTREEAKALFNGVAHPMLPPAKDKLLTALSAPQKDDGEGHHQVEIEFDGFNPSVRLLHPKDGDCAPAEGEWVRVSDLPKIEAAVEARVREGLLAARRDADGVPFLDAARALCPDIHHWEDGGWERYAADASACIDAFLNAALKPNGVEEKR